MITCSSCGELEITDIAIYSENLRKQDFSILPILPVCIHCGKEVEITDKCTGGNITVLNGTCGSGKSTIAELLADKGFLVIDGDCVLQSVNHKTGIKRVDFIEMADEIGTELDILSMFGDNFVLSTVIPPEDLDKYIGVFQSRNLNYRLFLLKPEYQTALERCRSRTCHASVTPEYWIQYFYETLHFDDRVIVVDNTNLTPEETAALILKAD